MSAIATAKVLSVNLSPGGIPKLPVESAALAAAGLDGDGHNHEKHVTPLQAVSLLDAEDLQDLRAEGYDVGPGSLGENLTVQGLQVDGLHPGDRLLLSAGVELEYTKARKPCYVLDAISPLLQKAVAGRCGGYARVVTGGRISPGQAIELRHVAAVT